MFDNLLIYYMFGTGNSYRASVWAAGEAKKSGLTIKTIPVNRAKPQEDIQRSKKTLLGMFYPTHGFTAPWAVIKLTLTMPVGKGTRVFLSACRAGWMIGPWHLPGLEGTATLLVALILWIKGYDVRGFQGLDMPCSWLAVHWGLKKENVAWFSERAEKKTREFSTLLLAGRRVYRGTIFILLGILFSYISLLYLVAGRFALAKIMYADENCNNCGICWNNCPFGAIRPAGGKKRQTPYWTFKCESCERCIAYCPKRAIQTGFLYVILLNWFVYGVIGFLPIRFFAYASKNIWLSWAASGIVIQILNIVFMIFWVFLGYFLLFWSARVKIFNRFHTLTTPTRIFRRYHEPQTKLKDLK